MLVATVKEYWHTDYILSNVLGSGELLFDHYLLPKDVDISSLDLFTIEQVAFIIGLVDDDYHRITCVGFLSKSDRDDFYEAIRKLTYGELREWTHDK